MIPNPLFEQGGPGAPDLAAVAQSMPPPPAPPTNVSADAAESKTAPNTLKRRGEAPADDMMAVSDPALAAGSLPRTLDQQDGKDAAASAPELAASAPELSSGPATSNEPPRTLGRDGTDVPAPRTLTRPQPRAEKSPPRTLKRPADLNTASAEPAPTSGMGGSVAPVPLAALPSEAPTPMTGSPEVKTQPLLTVRAVQLSDYASTSEIEMPPDDLGRKFPVTHFFERPIRAGKPRKPSDATVPNIASHRRV